VLFFARPGQPETVVGRSSTLVEQVDGCRTPELAVSTKVGSEESGRREPWWQRHLSWWRRHLSELVVALVAAVVGALIPEIFREDPPPRPPALGTIDSPRHAATVAPQGEAHGRLRDIPDAKHVWLAARKAGRQWAILRELSHDPTWKADVPRAAPRGQPLELVLLMVGTDGNERLSEARGGVLNVTDVPDASTLANVPTFYVSRTPPRNRLHAVFPQTRGSGGDDFRFERHGGRLDASFPDNPECHRPERAVGLRLDWDMSAQQYGGWGVAWRREPGRRGSFDASDFARLALSVKGQEGGETFVIGLKDTLGNETQIPTEEVGAIGADGWSKIVLPLDDFTGVDAESIENMNLGFNQLHGSGTVCIDEIAFEGRRDGDAADAS
jgi:hypothetical protein